MKAVRVYFIEVKGKKLSSALASWRAPPGEQSVLAFRSMLVFYLFFSTRTNWCIKLVNKCPGQDLISLERGWRAWTSVGCLCSEVLRWE